MGNWLGLRLLTLEIRSGRFCLRWKIGSLTVSKKRRTVSKKTSTLSKRMHPQKTRDVIVVLVLKDALGGSSCGG